MHKPFISPNRSKTVAEHIMLIFTTKGFHYLAYLQYTIWLHDKAEE